MTINLIRFRASQYGTFGKLYLNDDFECFTLEPAPGKVVASNVIQKPYPIPLGTYKVTLDIVSPKYRFRFPYSSRLICGRVPRLLNVPGFDGILIHIGNFVKDTAGCILVGQNVSLSRLYYSTNAFTALYKKLLPFKDNLKICVSVLSE